MAEETASVADVSRTDFTGGRNSRVRNNSGLSQRQCTPMPLPAVGTQTIIKGNGTNVGTVISLQCPAKHKLIGHNLVCVMGANSTQWVGETYCKPLALIEDFGFHVAVLASIVSSAIILLLSMAFITCCLLNCIKQERRKKYGGGTDLCKLEEQNEPQVDNRHRYSHRGRNNNNNTQEKLLLPEWDDHNHVLSVNRRACRCNHHSPSGLTGLPAACSSGPAPPLAPLPGRDYDQSLLPPHIEPEQNSGPPHQLGPIQSSSQTKSSCLIQISTLRSGSGLMWQCRGQEDSLLGLDQSAADVPNTRSINSAKEMSIRIIPV